MPCPYRRVGLGRDGRMFRAMSELRDPRHNPTQQSEKWDRASVQLRWEQDNLLAGAASQAELYRLFLRLLTLPIWLPVSVLAYFWKSRRRKREIADFARAFMGRGLTDHHQIALEYVGAHPDEYRYGEFDKAFPKIRETFKKIVQPAERG